MGPPAIPGGRSLAGRSPARGHLGSAIAELATRTWPHPSVPGRTLTFSAPTIERWFYQARSAADPVGRLARRPRSDRGTEKALAPWHLEELGRQYGANRHWSYRLHYDNLLALAQSDPRQGGSFPSYPTIRRAMRRRGWVQRSLARKPTPGQERALERLEKRETRLFESPAVHALWHLDFHHGSVRVLEPDGQWHTPLCLAVLDDRSRVCCHAQWFLAEDARSLIHGLLQAFCKRGLPRALLDDNGAAMIAEETESGLRRCGVSPDHTMSNSPNQNGKQERFWGTLEGRLIAMLKRIEPLTLEFLNTATLAWVEGDYNRKVHEEIRCPPLERMLAGPDVSREAPDIETLRRRFTRCDTRVQRRSDGTIRLGGVRFEVPSRLRTLRELHVRWMSWDLTCAWVVDGRTDDVLAQIRPVDLERNALGRRRAHVALDGAPVPPARPGDDPLPPLLKKLLADHAATGLPPPYIPLGDHDDDPRP